MREIFPAQPEPPEEGLLFYTMRADDIGKQVIKTDIGPVHVADCIGRVMPLDVGRRLYGRLMEDGRRTWSRESEAQYRNRVEARARPMLRGQTLD